MYFCFLGAIAHTFARAHTLSIAFVRLAKCVPVCELYNTKFSYIEIFPTCFISSNLRKCYLLIFEESLKTELTSAGSMMPMRYT